MKHSLRTYLLTISCFLLIVSLANSQQAYFNRITSEEGLSHNTVFSIAQDYKGFMWFGTRDGLSRYDSQVIRNYDFDLRSPDVEANRINCVYAVGHELWVGTAVGLFQYDFNEDAFRRINLGQLRVNVQTIRRSLAGELWVGSEDGIHVLNRQVRVRHILPRQSIHAICEFRRGAFLVLQGGKAFVVNTEGETLVTPAIEATSSEESSSFRNYTLYKDQAGQTWLGTNGTLLRLDEATMTFRSVEWFRRLFPTPMRVIRTISEDQAGNLWLGSEAGAVVINKERTGVQRYDQSFSDAPHQLTDRSIYSSYVSADGTVWLSSYFGGVNYTKPAGVSFSHLFAAGNGHSIMGKAVSQLQEDQQHRLWIGTEDGGVSVREPTGGQFTSFNRRTGLSDDNVHSLLPESNSRVWVGTFLGGLNRLNPRTGAVQVYTHSEGDSTSLSNNSVYAIFRDHRRVLWVGTQRGLNVLDEQTQRFRLFQPAELGTKFIYAVWEDSDNQLWIATRFAGIYRYDAGRQQLFHYDASNTPSLRSNQVISIYEDSRGKVWFGTLDGGVCCWDKPRQAFQRTAINQHLPSQTVYGTLLDDRGTYWFSTNRGLLSFAPAHNVYRAYDKGSGLQTTQFNFKSAFKDAQGTLYFGSVDGLCYFTPATIARQVVDPPVYFTDLQLFDKTVKVGPKSVLPRNLDSTPEITLAYSQNVVTLHFVAINYFSRGTNYYTYYLEGFEDGWSPKTTVNSRTYTNLSPGSYTFHVRAYRPNGELSAHERRLTLVVRPPFWRSGYAYGLYLLLGIAALLLYRRFITFLNEQKTAVRVERVEREKSEELNQQKLNFFTFLSNEFNTPITLIMAEVDELVRSNQAWRTDAATNYGVIKKNAKRLQILINQITQLRKTQREPQKLELTDADIVAFIKDTVQAFDPLLQARRLEKKLRFSQPYLSATFDAGKLEMILGNLVFFLAHELPEDGELAVAVAIASVTQQPVSQLTLRFALPAQPTLLPQLQHSYRVAENPDELFLQDQASSIGLHLTFNLLKLLGGTAEFDAPPEASALAITLPIRKSLLGRAAQAKQAPSLSAQLVRASDDSLPQAAAPLPAEAGPAAARPTLLIIDQSQDLMQFLKRHFQAEYRIVVANTFAEALKKAETSLPEIVLCDSAIVDKNNRSLCSALKANPLTQAIPVLLLLGDKDDKTILSGLNSGADGYLSKPFNLPELDLLIANHLRAIARLKNKLVDGLTDSRLTTLPTRNKEQEFVLKFAALVSQEFRNKDVDVDRLAQQMSCSRSQLHTKLKALTGFSTKEYLNDYRLTVARQLLENGLSVSEAAFETGFNDPNYFGRAFKKKYGVTPSKAG
ncbi:two-component regulator propeller domain-containing protein [Hymenobacter daeguensis]